MAARNNKIISFFTQLSAMSTPPLLAQLSSEDWNDYLPQCVLCGARLPTLAEVRRHLQCDHTVLSQDMGGLMLR